MGIPATLSSVPATTPYIQYVATLGQTVFPYPFVITQDSDLIVVVNGVTLNTDQGYSLSGQSNPTGGNVTFTLGQAANAIVTLYRDIVIERITQISQNSGFSSTAFNAEFNNIYLILQQLAESQSFSLQIPNTNNPAPVTTLLAANYALKYLAFDAFGNPTPALLTSSGALTQAIIAGLLVPQTAAEASAGVAPTNFQYQELDPRRYGFKGDGVTNDYTAVNNTILVAQQYKAAKIAFPPNSNVICNTGLTWDISKVSFDLNGSTVSFANLVSGVALTPTSSQASQNLGIASINARSFANGVLIGPGVTTTAVTGLSLTSAGNTIAAASFRNITFREFATDVTFGNNQFCQLFENCLFTLTAGAATTYSIISNTGTNNSESYTFQNCRWINKPLLINQLSGTADIYVHGGSMDGFTTAVLTTGGQVTLDGVHIESPTDTAYWFNSSTNGNITLTGRCNIVLDANKTSFPIFYSDSTNTNDGIVLDHVVFGLGSFTYSAVFSTVYGPVLIGGTGFAKARLVLQPNGSAHPAIASSLNLLAYPGFESANLTAEWTLTGSAAQSTVVAHTGTHSLAIPGATTGQAVTTQPCLPGQYAQGNFWYQVPASGWTGFFNCILSYVDKGGNTIASVTIFTITAQVAAWTLAQFKDTIPAPFGTVSATLLVNWTAGSTGTPIGYIDDVLFNVPG